MVTQNSHSNAAELPATGYLRIHQVLHFIPIGKSTWWKWVAEGKAPKPIKLGIKTTAWKAQDIAAFIAEIDQQGSAL